LSLKFTICVLALWPAAAAAQAPPTLEERDAILDEAREFALRYTESLPDFLCTETVHRFVQPRAMDWMALDTLTVDLAFSEKGERYKLVAIDGKPTNKAFGKTGGFTSSGDFGTLLEWIFRPKSQTRFEFQGCSDLRGREACAFEYHVDRAHSGYTLDVNSLLFANRVISGFGGTVSIDRKTHEVVSLAHAPEGLPLDWSVRETHSTLDYDYAQIEGRRFLVPRRAEMFVKMRDGSGRRNVMEFDNFRKFTAESFVTFDRDKD